MVFARPSLTCTAGRRCQPLRQYNALAALESSERKIKVSKRFWIVEVTRESAPGCWRENHESSKVSPFAANGAGLQTSTDSGEFDSLCSCAGDAAHILSSCWAYANRKPASFLAGASIALYAIAYVALFALPLLGRCAAKRFARVGEGNVADGIFPAWSRW